MKKTYIAPAKGIVVLKAKMALLAGSGDEQINVGSTYDGTSVLGRDDDGDDWDEE